jgi:hypothetical protein
MRLLNHEKYSLSPNNYEKYPRDEWDAKNLNKT